MGVLNLSLIFEENMKLGFVWLLSSGNQLLVKLVGR